ncbi:hypothetical protein ASPNIDRAFT_42531 [Aspergillus niger ATCC 1015]|uniref:Uncharacterized protein n=1 Tax=Aspergillus niger (strain ATCC 1015 / CBS 113.46 / FGSC A1144 / LSHB Ac4 / NCTC 3858a / NRRL 328 / USDA 3528.7) TaxID=380704 RepID=G3XV64_ASPNA|nr:hypothetical protein ASPNIDRAFT_42531 [Aspergillus niger ATCC 1015]
MRVASAAVVASLAAGAIATEYKTVYVTEYTTVCPKATSLATGPGAGSGSGAQTTPAAAQPTTVTISGTPYTYSTPFVTSTVTHCDKWYVLGSIRQDDRPNNLKTD